MTAYQQGKLSASSDHFSYVAQASPDTDMGREAKSFLEKIQTLQARWQYQVYGSLGFQYDSNVLLLNNTITRASTGDQRPAERWRDDDQLRRRLRAVAERHITLSLGYDFFQSVHFHLGRLQSAGPRPERRS